MNPFNFFPLVVSLRWQDTQITMFTVRKIIKIFIAEMGPLVLIIRSWQRETESGFSKSSDTSLPAN